MTATNAGGAFASLLTTAQTLLTNAVGERVRLTQVERLTDDERRNVVLRCQVEGASQGQPASIIIKQVVAQDYRPDAVDSWDTQRFFRDWAGAQFLTAISPDGTHSPRFYAGDPAQGFFLLEDLGVHHSLVEPLLEGDADRAERALLAFAARLGQLHAATIGGASHFEQLTGAINPALAVDVPAACLQHARELQDRAEQVQLVLEQQGVRLAGRFADDIREISKMVAEPGDFLAYVHGDPCPDNVFHTGDRLRLIDFEFGHFGHALRDAVYGRMFFPTCWCANQLPAGVVGRMEQVYRAELARTCTSARDERTFKTELVRMCGFWLIGILAWHLPRALQEDDTWGIATIRSRILARLQAFDEASAASNQLPALRETMAALLDHLQRNWPDTRPLPLYPAFRS
jgi:tRNA A-37 threonylcarbamoyl transferase component Bud32